MTVEKYAPGAMWDRKPRNIREERLTKFAGLLTFVQHRGGWLVSIPGDPAVVMQCLPHSTLPDDIEALGYRPVQDGTTQRILPHAITESFLIEGSTIPRILRHAGLVTVECWSFNL